MFFKKNVHAGAFFKTANRENEQRLASSTERTDQKVKSTSSPPLTRCSDFICHILVLINQHIQAVRWEEEAFWWKNLVAFTPNAFLSAFFSVSPVCLLCITCLSLQLWFSVCHLRWGDNGRLFKKAGVHVSRGDLNHLYKRHFEFWTRKTRH